MLKSYVLVGLRAGIKRDGWTAAVIADNLFNNKAVIDYNEIVPGLYPDGYYINRPRTITFAVSKAF